MRENFLRYIIFIFMVLLFTANFKIALLPKRFLSSCQMLGQEQTKYYRSLIFNRYFHYKNKLTEVLKHIY